MPRNSQLTQTDEYIFNCTYHYSFRNATIVEIKLLKEEIPENNYLFASAFLSENVLNFSLINGAFGTLGATTGNT